MIEDHPSPTAVAYAQALLDLANEAKNAPAIAQELNELKQLVQQHPDFAQALSDPAISRQDRGQLITRIFKGRVSNLVFDFLGLMNEKGRLNLFSAAASAFSDLLEDQQGKVEVDVTVAEKLGKEQLDSVRKRINEALKRDAVVHQYVDPKIIGGVVLRVRDQLIDGSVRAQLVAMRRKILEARPV